jgi:putative ABC transport system permease protein
VDSVQQVALVNEHFVRSRLEGRTPLGVVVRLPRLKQPPFGIKDEAFQIVGVVQDTLNNGLSDPVMPEVYLPFTAVGIANSLAVRTELDPAGVTRPVVSQVYAIDRNQPVTGVETLDTVLKNVEYATPRFNLALLSVFATLGVVLAIVGVYGVMSSAVAQQRQEIGVRMALGADGSTIARMVMARGSRLLIAGMVLGLVGSVAAARLLARQIWNVPAFDPIAFSAVSVVVLLAGLQACFWPARRAARVDPIIALREE